MIKSTSDPVSVYADSFIDNVRKYLELKTDNIAISGTPGQQLRLRHNKVIMDNCLRDKEPIRAIKVFLYIRDGVMK